jgi:hypothetical protein
LTARSSAALPEKQTQMPTRVQSIPIAETQTAHWSSDQSSLNPPGKPYGNSIGMRKNYFIDHRICAAIARKANRISAHPKL